MKANFLVTVPGESIPVKTAAEYDGPVPEKICDYLANRIVGLAKQGFCFPVTPGDVYGDLWLEVERRARNLPPLVSAQATTYLRRTVDNLIRKYFDRRVRPLRDIYRATDGRLRNEEAKRPDADAPEGKDVGLAASAAATEGYDYATKTIGATQPLTAQQLAEQLTDEDWARERREKAAFALDEVCTALLIHGGDEGKVIVRAFRAYVAADGNLVEAAHLAGVSKTKFYKSWPRALKVAKEIAEKEVPRWN